MLPWQSEPGVFGAVSMLCKYCDGLFILKLSDAKELKFAEDLPKMPGK